MKKTLLLLPLSIVFFACQPTKEQKLKNIAKLEYSVMEDAKSISSSKADSLIMMYEDFLGEFPKDSNSVMILYKASDVCANTKQCEKAIKYLERIIDDFPQSDLVEAATFKIGTVYEQTCQNKEKALECYKSFIEQYPKSKLAMDASVLIQMLSISDEMDIIRGFEAKNDSLSKVK